MIDKYALTFVFDLHNGTIERSLVFLLRGESEESHSNRHKTESVFVVIS